MRSAVTPRLARDVVLVTGARTAIGRASALALAAAGAKATVVDGDDQVAPPFAV